MKISFCALSCLVATVINYTCISQNLDYRGYAMKEEALEVYSDTLVYRFTPYSDQIMEAHIFSKTSTSIPVSHAVVAAPQFIASLNETENKLEYHTAGISVIIQKSPFKIAYRYKNKRVITQKTSIIQTDSSVAIGFQIKRDEKWYGAGARVVGLNRRKKRLQLYNKAHYGYGKYSELMNFGIPMAISSDRYAIHFDNPSKAYLDFDSEETNTLRYEATAKPIRYQLIVAEDWPELLQQYTYLTGRQPMPPRWAFGNFASRFGYHSEQETRAVVDRFRADQIPLDAVVLDVFWFGKTIKGHMGNLAFERETFPTPKKMITDFKRKGIQTILITEPFILSTSMRWEEAVSQNVLATDSLDRPYSFDFYFGNTGLIDIFRPKAKNWFWEHYKALAIEYGVSGWWGDLGEPEVHPADMKHFGGSANDLHNIFGHEWAKLLYEGYQKDFPDQRPFILMRAGYSGSQRYGMIPWSGDVDRSWAGLRSQPEITLAMGMQGMAYMHSDLGGFAGGEVFDPELYTRWLQYGVFQPIFRPHAQEHIPPEPIFHDVKTKSLAQKSIRLRYRLLPYNYTLAFENSQTGMPLLRPLFFENPDEIAYKNLDFAYLWGDHFLIAPVVQPGMARMEVPFPKGSRWFDFYSGKKYEGGHFTSVPVLEAHIPTFVRGGAFIPLAKAVQSTDQYTTKTLTLRYYFDDLVRQSYGKLYDDDGLTPYAFEKGEYELLKFESCTTAEDLEIRLEAEIGENYETIGREILLEIHNLTKTPNKVYLDNKIQEAYTWNSDLSILKINIQWKANSKMLIKVCF